MVCLIDAYMKFTGGSLNIFNLEKNNDTIIRADVNTKIISTTVPIYKENYGKFSMIGRLNTGKDLVDYLTELPSGPRYLFQEIKCNMHYDSNLAFMEYWKDYPGNKKRVIKLHCTVLKKVGLIIKIVASEKLPKPKPFTYMVNPYIIKPPEYTAACLLWKTLGGKEL